MSVLRDFASFLFTHNAEVGLMAFALGFVAGVPTALLLFGNGLTLGAFSALFFSRGLGLAYLGWLLPHGVVELTAAVLCGGAGFALARGVLFPGTRYAGRVAPAARADGRDRGRRLHRPLRSGGRAGGHLPATGRGRPRARHRHRGRRLIALAVWLSLVRLRVGRRVGPPPGQGDEPVEEVVP